jgi:single-strand DNA-binding protein
MLFAGWNPDYTYLTTNPKKGEDMSISLNHSIIAGNLTRDPETKYLANDKVVCKFSIANSQKFKVGDEQREKVIYLECQAWGKTAETIGKYATKGKPIIVEGKLEMDQWEDKDTGAKRSKITLNVERFHFVPDGKRGEASRPPEAGAESTTPQPAPSSAVKADDEPPF